MSTQHEKINAKFKQKVHFWGRITIAIAFFFSLSIPFYLTFIAGYPVDKAILIKGLIFVASFVGIIWIVEPISYFPILGASGSYMSFLSGNIGNMRMPVVGAVQNALELEPGSKKAEIAAIFGLVTSNLCNLAILLVVIVGGAAIVNKLPPTVLDAFTYAVPGIIGAMIVTFAAKMRLSHIVMTVILGLVVIQVIKLITPYAPQVGKLLSMGQIGVAAIFAIAFALVLARGAKRQDG